METQELDVAGLPTDVEAVVLFGSRARGDWDAASDTDIGVFAVAEQLDELVRVKDICNAAFDSRRVSVSVYSTDTAERLAGYGSLFLWHVRLEGNVVFQRSSWLSRLLRQDLRPYDASCACRDLETFGSVSREVEAALTTGKGTELFEAATLFAVLRGVGMIVGMRSGSPCFSRLEPIRQLLARIGDSDRLTEIELLKLAEAKLIYSRRKSADWQVSLLWLRETAAKVTSLVERSLAFV